MLNLKVLPDGLNGGPCVVCDEGHSSRRVKPITDAEATRCFEDFRSKTVTHRSRLSLGRGVSLPLLLLDLPENELGDRAVRALVSACVWGTVLVRDIHLYKNRLGDASAQALSVLLQLSPAPGVNGLHLSHNYMTQVGVGMMLTAAAKSRRYPIRTKQASTERHPLWLRVEKQWVSWPVLGSSRDQLFKMQKAEQLITHLAEKLTKSCQDNGSLPHDLDACDPGFKMFCIPRPQGGMTARFDDDEKSNNDDISSETALAASNELRHFCTSWRCRFKSEYGPMVHLPYFWQQGGQERKAPEAALLHNIDHGWKTWMPRRPIGARPKVAIEDKSEQPPALKDTPNTSSVIGAIENAHGEKRKISEGEIVVGTPLKRDARVGTIQVFTGRDDSKSKGKSSFEQDVDEPAAEEGGEENDEDDRLVVADTNPDDAQEEANELDIDDEESEGEEEKVDFEDAKVVSVQGTENIEPSHKQPEGTNELSAGADESGSLFSHESASGAQGPFLRRLRRRLVERHSLD